MKTILLLLVLCVTASAATPLPIKRPPPLRSPRHASEQKMTPMLKATTFTAASVNPLLPMHPFYRMVDSEYGHNEFSAEAFQPANQAVIFSVSPDMAAGQWIPLAWFSSYPSSQWVFAGITTDQPFIFIKAEAMPVRPAVLSRMSSTAVGSIWVNRNVRGVNAWRGRP